MSDEAKRAHKQYDVTMIRDFLEQLQWEVAASRIEHTAGDSLNPDVLARLQSYMERYNTVLGLSHVLENDVEPDDFKRASASYLDVRDTQYAAYEDALQILQPLFREALECAKRPGTIPQQTILASAILQAMKQRESSPDGDTGGS